MIVDSQGHVGSFENGGGLYGGNKRRGFVNGKWSISTLSPGWHRLTVSSACGDAACKTHTTTYYADGKAVGTNDYISESDFYAVGNYQAGYSSCSFLTPAAAAAATATATMHSLYYCSISIILFSVWSFAGW